MKLNNIDNDYREISILPTYEDISRSSNPELSPNLIDKPFNGCKEYLETHFDLLREELVRPLRDNIQIIKQLSQSKNCDFKKINECNFYSDITIVNYDIDINIGPVLVMKFDIESLKDVDWSESSLLMTGTLLCLSADCFQSLDDVIFAIVTKRGLDENGIKNSKKGSINEITVHVDKSRFFELMISIKSNKKYVAIEAKAYFEGIRHTLKKLQHLGTDHGERMVFPLKRYIIDLKKDVHSPQYLTHEMYYNLSSSAKPMTKREDEQLNQSDDESGTKESEETPLLSVPILSENAFTHLMSSLKSTFDSDQFKAFFSALTKEFTVIQGPPGTGKTYVGLRIVQSLLQNIQIWSKEESSPILILCYKNHALDQFLEGILDKISDKIIRIGFKCESKMLEDYRLENFRKKVTQKDMSVDEKEDLKLSEIRKKIRKKIRKLFLIVLSRRRDFEQICEDISDALTTIVGDNLIPYIKQKHLRQLQSFDPNFTESIKIWLSREPEANDRINDICVPKITDFISPSVLSKLNSPNIMSKYEMTDVSDINSLSRKSRWRLYRYWNNEYLQSLRQIGEQIFQNIQSSITRLNDAKVEEDYYLVRDAHVLGMTITGAAKRSKLIELLNPKIVIVEEAAEVLESHFFASLPSQVQHLIIIGDHSQLRPITNVHELTTKYNFDISLFERMVMNNIPYSQLTLQHRMRPCISKLLKVANIYDNLRDNQSVLNYPKVQFTVDKDMFFFNHCVDEDNNWNRDVIDASRSNAYEAKMIVELTRYFLLRGVTEDKITILTTYGAQLNCIKVLMKDDPFFVKPPQEDNGLNNKDDDPPKELRVRVSTVDGYQGEENDIILISFVRSNSKGNIGFLKIPNRVCVALSRARHGLFCFGNFTAMAKDSIMWKNIVKHLKEEKSYGNVLNLGCQCPNSQYEITMPHHFGLYNHNIRLKPKCECIR